MAGCESWGKVAAAVASVPGLHGFMRVYSLQVKGLPDKFVSGC